MADFHPKIEEAIQQLDAMILNGDYHYDATQSEEIGAYLTRWQRVHTQNVETAKEAALAEEL